MEELNLYNKTKIKNNKINCGVISASLIPLHSWVFYLDQKSIHINLIIAESISMKRLGL